MKLSALCLVLGLGLSSVMTSVLAEEKGLQALDLPELIKNAERGDLKQQFNLGQYYAKGIGGNVDYAQAFKWFEKAAKNGLAEAQLNLAVLYLVGDGVKKNEKKGLEWLVKSANSGYVDAQYGLGKLYYYGNAVEKDFSKAATWFEQAAAQQHAEAAFKLFSIYLYNDEIKDRRKAVKYLKQASDLGLADAQIELGHLYRYGTLGLVDKNPQKAYELYSLAAHQGDKDAAGLMEDMQVKGDGVEKDVVKELAYYLKSSDRRDADKQYQLAVQYCEGNGVTQNYTTCTQLLERSGLNGSSEAYVLLGVMNLDGSQLKNFDRKKAFDYLKKAAEQNNATAQYFYAYFVKNGEFTKKDLQQWVKLITSSAEKGYSNAQFALGRAYEEGNGVTPNYDKAIHWYTLAAQQGDKDAQFRLGYIYSSGLGGHNDYVRAFSWYKTAADNGSIAAMTNLGVMYQRGNGISRNVGLASEYYIKAANLGDEVAQYNIGMMYYNGEGVPRNLVEAKRWVQKSANNGYQHAKLFLKGWK